jgi:transposase-like protein
MASTSKSPATRTRRKARTLAFPAGFRLRIVMLFIEEGYSARLLVEQFGISTHSILRWVRAYRLNGAAGLAPKVPVGRVSRVPAEVRQQAVAVKAAHPGFQVTFVRSVLYMSSGAVAPLTEGGPPSDQTSRINCAPPSEPGPGRR